MKMSFPSDSQYLAQTDFDQAGTNCTIREVRTAVMDDEKHKYILYLNQFDKGMVLNQINGNTLIAFYGDEADDWTGKWINVFVDPTVSFGGKVTGGLRIRKPQRPADDWNPDLEPQGAGDGTAKVYEPGSEG